MSSQKSGFESLLSIYFHIEICTHIPTSKQVRSQELDVSYIKANLVDSFSSFSKISADVCALRSCNYLILSSPRFIEKQWRAQKLILGCCSFDHSAMCNFLFFNWKMEGILTIKLIFTLFINLLIQIQNKKGCHFSKPHDFSILP